MPDVATQRLDTTVAVHTEQLRRMEDAHAAFSSKLDKALEVLQKVSGTQDLITQQMETNADMVQSISDDVHGVKGRLDVNEKAIAKIDGAVGFAKYLGGSSAVVAIVTAASHFFGVGGAHPNP